ncbi:MULTISPECIES: hypothetical protein [unclassified Frondihabitans]|uniref:hypothetical protein n=1 Tax=unclassified Frondihabitans TaxID=2626248 RepID=UPI000F4EC90B|nr:MULTISPECIES: hypothetical protein [unclassified Frondihabitans]RPE75212.1 hypothetical protein EDF37_2816 [Frondihabitans sp. PhB153]RPF04454.1 hypothetical protein EDF39_2884 [Frondihabitans sp. PhB161]
MTVHLLTIPEAAPQFRKTEPAMRFWLQTKDCPLKTLKIGGRRFVTQESIDAFFAKAIAEVAA